MSIGARLEELRKAAKLTQQQVADVVGTTKQYVGRLEKSQNQNPNGVFLTGWARYFGVNPRWLSTGEGPKQGSPEPSQPARPDFVKMGHAVVVLRHYLELTGDPVDWLGDPVMLEAAYEVVEEFTGEKPQDNVLDMTKILAKKIRGHSDGQQDQVRGARAASGSKS